MPSDAPEAEGHKSILTSSSTGLYESFTKLSLAANTYAHSDNVEASNCESFFSLSELTRKVPNLYDKETEPTSWCALYRTDHNVCKWSAIPSNSLEVYSKAAGYCLWIYKGKYVSLASNVDKVRTLLYVLYLHWKSGTLSIDKGHTCQTQSKNCRNIGDLSFGEVEFPKRSLNLCPNDSHSFSISTCRQNKGSKVAVIVKQSGY